MNKMMRERGESVRSGMPVALVNRASDSTFTNLNLHDSKGLIWSDKSNQLRGYSERQEDNGNDDERRNSSDVDSDDIDA
jgi:hypothetical protein